MFRLQRWLVNRQIPLGINGRRATYGVKWAWSRAGGTRKAGCYLLRPRIRGVKGGCEGRGVTMRADANAALAALRLGAGGSALQAPGRALWRKCALQDLWQLRQRWRTCRAQSLDQARAVERAHLIKQDQSRLALKSDRHAKRRRMAAGRHRGDDHRAQVVVHFRREMATQGRLLWTALPTIGSSTASQASPRFTTSGAHRRRCQTRATPARRRAHWRWPGRRSPNLRAPSGAPGAVTSAPFSVVITASSSSPIWASSGFGMMMPCELPTLRRMVFVTVYRRDARG